MQLARLRSVKPLYAAPVIANEHADILDIIDRSHRFYPVLRCLSLRHPEPVDRNTLVWMGGFSALGAVSGMAAFEFWKNQVDLDLPKLGWRVAEKNEHYWLVKL
jgi:hypothetical protein